MFPSDLVEQRLLREAPLLLLIESLRPFSHGGAGGVIRGGVPERSGVVAEIDGRARAFAAKMDGRARAFSAQTRLVSKFCGWILAREDAQVDDTTPFPRARQSYLEQRDEAGGSFS